MVRPLFSSCASKLPAVTTSTALWLHQFLPVRPQISTADPKINKYVQRGEKNASVGSFLRPLPPPPRRGSLPPLPHSVSAGGTVWKDRNGFLSDRGRWRSLPQMEEGKRRRRMMMATAAIVNAAISCLSPAILPVEIVQR